MSNIMQVVAAIATIIGLIAGLVQIRDSIGKNAFKTLLGLGVICAALMFAFYFFYLGPKSIGDRFAANYSSLNAGAMQQDICVDSPSYDDFAAIGGIFTLGSAVMGGTTPISVYSQSFTPLSNYYEFSYTLANPFGNDQRNGYVGLDIRSSGLTEFCIGNLYTTSTSDGAINSNNLSVSSGNFRDGFAYAVTNFRTRPSRQQGWQLITFDLVVENISERSAWFPTPNTNQICGDSIDSNGHTREFCAFVNQATDYEGIDGDNNFKALLLVPGVKVVIPITSVEIPSAYSLSQIDFNKYGDYQGIFVDTKYVHTSSMLFTRDDFNEVLIIPFESPPTSIQLYDGEQRLTWLALDGKYQATIFNCRIDEEYDFSLECDGSLQNQSGENIRDFPKTNEGGPVVFIYNSKGQYSFGNLNFSYLDGKLGIAPGVSKEGEIGIGRAFEHGDWIDLLIAPDIKSLPMARFRIEGTGRK